MTNIEPGGQNAEVVNACQAVELRERTTPWPRKWRWR